MMWNVLMEAFGLYLKIYWRCSCSGVEMGIADGVSGYLIHFNSQHLITCWSRHGNIQSFTSCTSLCISAASSLANAVERHGTQLFFIRLL